MSVKRTTIVLFDVDGTLLSCGGAGRAAMRSAANALLGREDVFDFRFDGLTDYVIARRALVAAGREPSPAALDALIDRYLESLDPALERAPAFRVLPGVTSLLDALQGRGALVGLGTGNVERGARAKLARAGLAERFAFGGFGCDHEERAKLLEAGARRGRALAAGGACQVVVVGDTPHDVTAARAIGARVVAVATGRHDESALEGTAPDAVLCNLEHTRALDAILAA